MAHRNEDDSNSAQNNFKFKVKKLNAAIIREEGTRQRSQKS